MTGEEEERREKRVLVGCPTVGGDKVRREPKQRRARENASLVLSSLRHPQPTKPPTSQAKMSISQSVHQVAYKIHKVERVRHAVAHPGQHAHQGVKWRIRRAAHGLLDRFLRCFCCGKL